MNGALHDIDWGATPLGPIEQWPDNLRFAASLCEHSLLPTTIFWGPEYRLVYNHAFAQGPAQHPAAGPAVPARAIFADIWPVLGAQLDQVRTTGESFTSPEQMLPAMRDGMPVEIWWSYSLTPIFAEDGSVAGIFSPGQEVTRAVLTERRLSFQIMLADSLRGLNDSTRIQQAATQLLGQHLRASRVGYAEIDEEGKAILVRCDWTRDHYVPSLEGQSAPMASFGPEAAESLAAGEAIAVADLQSATEIDQGFLEIWEAIGARAFIVVPLVRGGKLRAVLYVHEQAPRQWQRAEIAMARDVAERTWAAVRRAEAEQGLRESEDHYRHAVELNPQVSWTALPDGKLNRVARRWHDWTGTAGLGDTYLLGIHPDDRQRTLEAWSRSVATGEPYDIEHRVSQRDGSFRWCRSRAFPRYGEEGKICLWYGATEDIHERKQGEDHQRLLINELNHRVKNTLATVQAIAFQTLKGDISLAEARSRFEARLLALSRAHNLLTEQNWEGTSLERVVADATEYLAGEQSRFTVNGEPIWLAPRAALALALALHELCTNAAKYGALSNDAGRVAIDWTLADGALRIEWKESNGPLVEEPRRRGFGSRLIEKGMDADLGGSAKLAFEPDGLRCVIIASLDAIRAPEAELG